MGGYLGGSRGTAYAASKFAVAGFTESLSLELEEFGITATIVGPGYFRTDFLAVYRFEYRDLRGDPDSGDQPLTFIGYRSGS
jgi:NAD(P)-dependent dehydrogenase (short-subunit alcohol dehydrogenase family)